MPARICLFAAAFGFTCLILLSTNLSAQQPKVLAPHKPILPIVTPQPNWHVRPSTQRSMVGGFWMTDSDFRSTLYIKNSVKNAGVNVTPILYLSNGKSYTLSDVLLDPSGTAVINLNNELEKQGIAPWATLSGYVEVKYTWGWDPICVTLQNVDTTHSLIFTYQLHSSTPRRSSQNVSATPQSTQSVEGLWWKHESTITGFVALSNVQPQPVTATLSATDDQGNLVKEHSVAISPHGTKLVKLDELQYAPSTHGGLTVTYQGTKDAVLINGGLEDPATGYSATLRFYPTPSQKVKPTEQEYAELGLMAGAADPMMSFPAGTVFTPYSIVRNITEQPVEITPVLWWMEAGAPRSSRLTQFALAAHSTQKLPMESLLSQAGLPNFNGSFNLILETNANRGGLLMASGSVDQRNTYVFEVLPEGIGESASKSVSYWSTGKGDDTMVTIWNPADEHQDFVFTLFFSGGSYKYPISLGPRVTRTFNVSEILHTGAPDEDGNVIPGTVHEGSAEISGPLGETQAILVGIAVGTYNIQKATCGDPCTVCNGVDESGDVEVAPFALKVGGTVTEELIATWNTGTKQNIGGTWSSSNTKIGTVSSGTVTGVSPGTFDVYAEAEYYIYDSCEVNGPCPQGLVSGGGGGTTVGITGVDPGDLVLGTGEPPLAPGAMTISGYGFSSLRASYSCV